MAQRFSRVAESASNVAMLETDSAFERARELGLSLAGSSCAATVYAKTPALVNRAVQRLTEYLSHTCPKHVEFFAAGEAA